MNGGFFSRIDYHVYLERLAKYREKYGYSVHAYCLMPNRASAIGKLRSALGEIHARAPAVL